MAIVVPVVSTWDGKGIDKAVSEIKRVDGAFGKFMKTSEILSASFIKTGQNLTRSVTVPLVGVGWAIKKAADAAMEDEKAQRQLAVTMRNVTKSTDAQISAMEQFVTQMQMTYGVSDNALRPALATLIRVTKDLGKAQKLTGLALDISAGSSRDLSSVSLALAKAYGGNFTALQRLGVVIPENIKKTKDFGAVTEYLNGVFGGQAVAAANTYAGRLAITKERIGEVQESIGYALLPALADLMDMINKNVVPAVERFAAWFEQLSDKTKKQILIVGAFVAALGPALIGIGYMIKMIQLLAGAFAFLLKRVVLIPAAILFIITAMVKSADASKSWGQALFTVIRGIVIGFVQVVNAALTVGNALIWVANAFRKLRGEDPLAGFTKNVDFLITGVDNAFSAVSKFTAAMSKQESELSRAVQTANGLADSLGGTGTSGGSGKQSVATAATNAKKAMEIFKTSLDAAKQDLSDAKSRFDDFAKSVTGSIASVINFGDAANAETGTFLENLMAQATKASEFGNKIQQLLTMGLSQNAIGQVLSAGADAGLKIADEIIAGGASVVNQVNTIVDATQSLAEQVGQSSAQAFYGAGVAQGEAMVQGVIDAITRAGFSLTAGGDIVNQKAIDKVNAQLAAYKKSGGKLTKKEKAKITDLANSLGVDVPMMAKGGIVTAPTLAMIGEAGPEAVVPLDRMNNGGGQYNITVNAGMGADGAQIGREIVDAIKRYERTSGKVFASA